VRSDFLPPHKGFALLVHLPEVVLPVPDLAHVHLYLFCLGEELLHFVADTWGSLASRVPSTPALLHVMPVAITVVIVLVVILLLVMLLILLLLRLVAQLLGVPWVLLLMPMLWRVILNYVQQVVHCS
jgi:hypothetical protein